MPGRDRAQQRDQILRLVVVVAGPCVKLVILTRLRVRAADLTTVQREAEGATVEREEVMADGLIHVAVCICVGGAERGVEVRETDDGVVVGEAVREGVEGVFAAGEEGDEVERGHGGRWGSGGWCRLAASSSCSLCVWGAMCVLLYPFYYTAKRLSTVRFMGSACTGRRCWISDAGGKNWI